MKEVLVSVGELAQITGVNVSTLRPWLGNYRIGKFITKAKLGDRYKIAIRLNKVCAYRLCDIFRKYMRNDAIENLIKYFDELKESEKQNDKDDRTAISDIRP